MLYAQEYFREVSFTPPFDHQNNVERNQIYLLVNCTGVCEIPYSFDRIQPGGRNDFYMMYLLNGSLAVTTGDSANTSVFLPEHFLIIPPHTFFRYKPVGSEPIRYFWVHFTGYCAADLLSGCFLPLLTPCSVEFHTELEEKFTALFQVFIQRTPCMDTAAAARLMDICVFFGQALQSRKNLSSGHTSLAPKRLCTSVTYIHENISQPLTVSALAKMENLGVSRYNSLFHALFGTSPMAYIRSLRMQQAVALLVQTNLSITRIASSVGYEDPLYFSRAFKQTFRMSPSHYRSLHTQTLP